MKRPLSVKIRPYERIGGLLFLGVYVFLLGPGISRGLTLLHLPADVLTLNRVYYVAGFLGTALLLWRFLRDSLADAAKAPGPLLRGAFFGWCLYAAVQVGTGILLEVFAPELSSPNDRAVADMAAENFPMMLAATVLLTPLTEEALLRGVLFGSLRERSRPAAYFVTILVFALMHVAPYLSEMTPGAAARSGLLYLLPGAALCACYELGGNIWAPVLAHAVINGIGMWALKG